MVSWKLLKLPGRDVAGLGQNLTTGEDVTLTSHEDESALAYNVFALSALTGGPGIPIYHWHGKHTNKYILIIDLRGPSLEEVFEKNGREFKTPTLVYLAEQLVARLQYIHGRSITVGKLTPYSCSVGSQQWRSPQLLIDRFSPPAGAQTFAQDLNSLGELLLYFCNGFVTWEQFQVARKNSHSFTPHGTLSVFICELLSQNPPNYPRLKLMIEHMYNSLDVPERFLPFYNNERFMSARIDSTGVLFAHLEKHLAKIGCEVKGHQSCLCEMVPSSLGLILDLYYELFIRLRPRHSKGLYLVRAHHLPNRLWRDLRWLITATTKESTMKQKSFADMIYSFLTVLFETVPHYRIYWTEYLLSQAHRQRELEVDFNRRQAWVSTIRHWEIELHRLKAMPPEWLVV
ncbi:casein kinase family protein [Aspergillus saccharolyticus JOP 1030-1]|uniref:Kinase-like protein n=1 Tax=Aspergillus saccharolyticus JOP 1030-1 TaxID=1450539 RepID=A0A318ZRK0_9EURO|nr:hypothetical protein BP01DRAFT_17541 [Aspergillus saccharolyticus JOP 1030-1]PYH46580.1 hypothetical protein BP01DRAFT_17541 [Aspergillus saccharolyticus JOP 1030-1]